MTRRIADFDFWKPGYGGAVVNIYAPGTNTLINIFLDEALTVPAENPQILNALIGPDGTRFGKFARPVYTNQPYYYNIQGTEDSGIVRPSLSSLDGEDASTATITAEGSDFPVTLEKFAAMTVNVGMYGPFVSGSGGIAATNTATLELAIAALPNGGQVIVPAGTYNVNGTEIPQGVEIVGSGRESTILKSVLGAVSFTMVGGRSGFRSITLDGNSLSLNSIAIKSVGNDEIILDNVMIRRFETGLHCIGGKGHIYNDLSIENVVVGAKFHGDLNTGGGGGGGVFSDLVWTGGLVSVATSAGVSFSYEDEICHNALLQGVGFEDCPGIGMVINGAQSLKIEGCWFTGNTINVDVHDDSLVLNITQDYRNDVINVDFSGGRMNGGSFTASGTLQNVALRNMKLEDVDFVMAVPIKNFLVVQDCFEDTAITITGDTSKFLRKTTSLDGTSLGLTTAAVATKAWNMTLKPGQTVYLEAKVIAKGRNNTDRAIYHKAVGAFLAGATLNYDTQTANFTVGTILTGQTSGASGRIQADSDSGTTGALTLTDVQGTFIDNEIITDNNGTPGSATANGLIVVGNVSLDTVGTVSLRADYETTAGFDVTFVPNQQDIEVRVLGAASKTVEWTCNVTVVSS